MAVTVTAHTHAAEVLDEVAPFLRTDPVRGNLVATGIRRGAAAPVPGHVWVAREDGAIAGVASQWSAHLPAVLAPAAPPVARALAEAAAADAPGLPGVVGEVGASAAFAGRWTEVAGVGAVPVEGQRLYELATLAPVASPPGRPRAADEADRDRLIDWLQRFHEDTGVTPSEPAADAIDRYLAEGGVWLWDDRELCASAALTAPVEGVVRIGMVFTPRPRRGRGFAGALVGAVAGQAIRAGHRVALYADLGNPTSNGLYQRMGFRAVAEVLRYRFA